jgi:uncharacterized protein
MVNRSRGRHTVSMGSPLDAVRRGLWALAGLLCVAVGGVGIVVPGLPTTVFFIMAAWCFARSSNRLERWVLGLPKIGPAVRDYRSGHGMPRRAKQFAVTSIVVFSALSIAVVELLPIRLSIGVLAVVGAAYVWWRVPTADDRMPAADAN